MYETDVYDFDGTIYRGDSSVDFLIYTIINKKSLIRYIPKIILFAGLCAVKIVKLEKFKEVAFSIAKNVENINELIEGFWRKKEKNINEFFLKNIKKCDNNIVISASPEFLLKPYLSKFANVQVIGTKFNEKWKIIGKNCKGEEKVRILKEIFPDIIIENFYSDSDNDLPLVKIAKKAYRVTDGEVQEWNIN